MTADLTTSNADVIDELRATVTGTVLAAGEPGFDEACTGHNPAARHQPELVVRAATTTDLTATVAVAARHDLRIQVQNSGHGPSLLSRGGILLRVDDLTGVTVDPAAGTVRVAPGVTWGELLTACAEHGVLPLGMGSVASVGVVGYTLGGGLGPLARQQGYAADHVVAVEIVTADGTEHHVDAQHEPDLFWALRGGRLVPGVVTALTLATVPEPTVTATRLTYPRPDVAAALATYADWRAGLDDNTASLATLFRFPDLEALPPFLRGQRFLQLDVLHLGDTTVAAVDELVAAHAPAEREDFTGTPAAWLAAQVGPPPVPSWQSSFQLDDLTPPVVADLLAGAGPETEAPWGVIELRALGGAAVAPPAVPNAVGRRGGLLVNLVATGDPATFGALPGLRDELQARFGDHAQDGTLVNFHGIAPGYADLDRAWPVETGARLSEIRDRYDPTGRFRPDPL